MQRTTSRLILFVLIAAVLLAACSPAESLSEDARQQTLSVMVSTMSSTETVDAPQPAETLPVASPTLEQAAQVAPTETPLPTQTLAPTEDPRPDPHHWSSWPVVPWVSGTTKYIYQTGMSNGADPKMVSVIGDCQSEPNVFLGIYDGDRYVLGEDYVYLEETIAHFNGSFSHHSLSVVDGLSAPSALSPMWADQDQCNPDENPVLCEMRVNRPAFVFINLGTVWKAGASAEKYKEYLRQIVEIVISYGGIPILSTKADNVEGDHSINRATVEIAYEYDVPLWNFWAAADILPNHGLDAGRDNIYLTPDGWNRRNFTALQALDAVWRGVTAATN